MRNYILALAALPLLACTPAGDKADHGEAIAQGAGVGDKPTGRSGDPVAKGARKGPIPANIDEGLEPVPAPAGNDQASQNRPGERPAMIPAQFRGRWGINTADCKGDAAAKGLLTIQDRQLIFYESRGMLDRAEPSTAPNSFVASYRFSGEGQQWTRTETLTLSGDKLERRSEPAADQSEPVETLTYARCSK